MKGIEFKKVKQPKDGNCFFHSVSLLFKFYNLYDLSHEEIRKKVSEYHKTHCNIEHSKRISPLGEWAETEDVIATSHIFKVTFKVWETKNNMWITFGQYKKKLYIYNHDMLHFDSLIRLN